MKDFTKPLSQSLLNIEDKRRSNLFPWRGQFSPQLIEYLLKAYCDTGSTVLDPFAGSGTVLHEAALAKLAAFGYEINPSAWCFSKLYEIANVHPMERETTISELRRQVNSEFPITISREDEPPLEDIERRVVSIGKNLSRPAKILLNALVVILDVHNSHVTNSFVQGKYAALSKLVRNLPYSDQRIEVDLQDARNLPLDDKVVDFVLTSPPYINVFNYHQNYRRSVEVLGWNLLRVARSEIGSNRANRSNRFYTVVQYCIDMANAIHELARVLKPSGRAIMILGYQSKVLGATFYNADILAQTAHGSRMFDVILRQHRVFTNRFGTSIREDILNLQRNDQQSGFESTTKLGRDIALQALALARKTVPEGNHALLGDAVSQISEITGTPYFDGISYEKYQSRKDVMMVKERGVSA